MYTIVDKNNLSSWVPFKVSGFGGFPLTSSEEKIQSMIQSENDAMTESMKKVLSKADLFEDMNKLKASWKVQGDNITVMAEVLRYYKEKWISVEWMDIDTELRNIEGVSNNIEANSDEVGEVSENSDSKWFFGNIGQGMTDLMWWAISWAAKWVWNAFGWLAWNTIGKWVDKIFWLEWEKSLENMFEKTPWEVWSSMKSMLGVEEWSFLDGVGEFGAELWLLFTPTGAWNLISKYPKASGMIKTLSSKIDDIGKHAPRVYDLLKAATSWAIDMWKFSIIDEGDVEASDLAMWAAFWAAFNLWWRAITSVKDYFWKALPEKMMVTQLVNPSDLKNINERLAKLNWSEPTMTELSNWMLKNNLKWTKEQIQQQLTSKIDDSVNKINSMLSSNTKVYNNFTVESLQKALNQNIKKYMENIWDDLVATVWNESLVKQYQSLINKKWLTLSEINAWRKLLADWLFTKQWTQKELASLSWLQNVWKEVSKFLDDTVRWFRATNKDIETAIALSNWIAKKEANEVARKMLAYAGVWSWIWWTASIISWNNDPISILKNMLIGWAIGWAWNKTISKFNSTEVQTKLANLLTKFWPDDASMLKKVLEWWKFNTIPAATLKKIDNLTTKVMNEDFNTTLANMINWKSLGNIQNTWINLWMPSDKLLKAGIKDLEINMSPGRIIKKSQQKNHPFDLSILENLPEKIQNPVAIFESSTRDWAKVILTDIKHNWKNYIAAIEIASWNKWNLVNSIRSINPRDISQLLDYFSKWKELYVDQIKFLKMLESSWIVSTIWIWATWKLIDEE